MDSVQANPSTRILPVGRQLELPQIGNAQPASNLPKSEYVTHRRHSPLRRGFRRQRTIVRQVPCPTESTASYRCLYPRHTQQNRSEEKDYYKGA